MVGGSQLQVDGGREEQTREGENDKKQSGRRVSLNSLTQFSRVISFFSKAMDS
jgi:hypothetical protein